MGSGFCQRVRFRFYKHGDLRFIGYGDLMRTLERVFRRAKLDFWMSEGYHPKPRVRFPSALPLGIASTSEIVEIELGSPLSTAERLERLRRRCPEGLVFRSAEDVSTSVVKPVVEWIAYELKDSRVSANRFIREDLEIFQVGSRLDMPVWTNQTNQCSEFFSVHFSGRRCARNDINRYPSRKCWVEGGFSTAGFDGTGRQVMFLPEWRSACRIRQRQGH